MEPIKKRQKKKEAEDEASYLYNQNDEDLSPEELLKKKRLEKNREAAQQFRQRQREHMNSLDNEVSMLSQQQADMTSKITLLGSENDRLKEQIRNMREFVSEVVKAQFSAPFMTSMFQTPSGATGSMSQNHLPTGLNPNMGMGMGMPDQRQQHQQHQQQQNFGGKNPMIDSGSLSGAIVPYPTTAPSHAMHQGLDPNAGILRALQQVGMSLNPQDQSGPPSFPFSHQTTPPLPPSSSNFGLHSHNTVITSSNIPSTQFADLVSPPVDYDPTYFSSPQAYSGTYDPQFGQSPGAPLSHDQGSGFGLSVPMEPSEDPMLLDIKMERDDLDDDTSSGHHSSVFGSHMEHTESLFLNSPDELLTGSPSTFLSSVDEYFS